MVPGQFGETGTQLSVDDHVDVNVTAQHAFSWVSGRHTHHTASFIYLFQRVS